jgi:hypothetical protein
MTGTKAERAKATMDEREKWGDRGNRAAERGRPDTERHILKSMKFFLDS